MHAGHAACQVLRVDWKREQLLFLEYLAESLLDAIVVVIKCFVECFSNTVGEFLPDSLSFECFQVCSDDSPHSLLDALANEEIVSE